MIVDYEPKERMPLILKGCCIKDHHYDHYDNYDAIEVNYYDAIPKDYEGVMGVPITFLDRYNPNQFSIVGLGTGELGKQLGAIYSDNKYKEIKSINSSFR